MRTRSPRMAPPVNGDDGSMASTATRSPRRAASPISALVSVDLPAPGDPGDARPCWRHRRAGGSAGRRPGPPRRPARPSDSRRASAPRSPARAAVSSARDRSTARGTPQRTRHWRQPARGTARRPGQGGPGDQRETAVSPISVAASPTSMTSVTPSTRSFRIRSMPAFSVTVEAGHDTQAPISSTRDDPGVLVDVAQVRCRRCRPGWPGGSPG